MRAVIQRVKYASVTVDGAVVGRIDGGFMILLGIKQGDTTTQADILASKIIKMRIFEDEAGKINKSLADVNGEVLVIPQFTLYANCVHGNRPDFLTSAKPSEAEPLFEYFTSQINKSVETTEKGIFGADMKVELLNDGPFTIILDTDELNKKS